MSILISHETPIKYIDNSIYYNDYDYCLVHLCDEHEEYLNFFKNSIKRGREVLLDNSIFELGVAFDWDKFAKRVEEIKPTFYIVPDVLEDASGTIQNFERFNNIYKNLPGMNIGVVQGKTKKELVDCYKFMSEKADYIAISFDYSYYDVTGYSDCKLERYMLGRLEFVKWLIQEGIWNCFKPHHLLGCSLAREFKYYTGVRGIRSLDTSNPVVAALNGERYIKGIGLRGKSPIKLADLIDVDFDFDTQELIYDNAEEFKCIVNYTQ
jgi:hypothetical protein